MDIEKRKLDYILEESKLTIESVDRHFECIDKRMKKIKIGADMLRQGSWDCFPVVVTGIANYESGIIQIYEKQFDSYSDISVLFLMTKDEFKNRWI